VPPRDADPRLPEGLNAVFARGFSPRPERRYAHAGEFARDLHGAAGAVLGLEIVHGGEEAPTARQATTVRGEAPTTAPAPTQVAAAAETVIMALPSTHAEGVVAFESNPPGALVYVDSEPVGRAPVPPVSVSFGRHLVRMEAEGRETVSAAIEVPPERRLRLVSFTLPPAASGTGGVQPGQLVPFGPEVTPPWRLSGPVPAYPEDARARGLEGSPIVELWVDESGDVINAAIVESAGAILDDALLSAARCWRFAPATLRGVPVTTRITVQHLFRR
jgi:TonB family protein